MSLSEEQHLILQSVYDRFQADCMWPTFITVDRPLRRSHGLDTGSAIQSIPEALLIRSQPGNYRPNPADQVRLTLLGIAACAGSEDDIDRFVRLLRWLAQRELEYEPTAGTTETMPRVTSTEVGRYLGLGPSDTDALGRLYVMRIMQNFP